MADFDPDAPMQQKETVQQQQTIQDQGNQNVIYTDKLYDVDPEVKKMAEDNIPEGCTKIFKLEWWQQFFQNDTKEVFSKGNFMQDIQDKQKPDLWYPIWMSVTLVFLSFVCSIATNLTVDDADFKKSGTQIGVLAAIIIGYTFIIPCIFAAVAWCLDMEDLVSYCQTILIPAMAFYFVVQVLVANDVLKAIDIAIFSFCAVWSELFVLIQGIKYIKSFKGTKGQVLGITITYLIALGCMMFIVNKSD